MKLNNNNGSRTSSFAQKLWFSSCGVGLFILCGAAHALCTNNTSPASWTNPAHWSGTCTSGPTAGESIAVTANSVVNIPAGAFTVAGLTLNDGVDLVGAGSAATTLTSNGAVFFQGSSASIRLNNITVSGSTTAVLRVLHTLELNNSDLRNKFTSATASEIAANVQITLDGTSNFYNDSGAKLTVFGGAAFNRSAVTAGAKFFRNLSVVNNALDIQGASAFNVDLENQGEIVLPNLASALTVPDGANFSMASANALLTGLGKIIAINNDITIANGKVAGSLKFQVASGK